MPNKSFEERFNKEGFTETDGLFSKDELVGWEKRLFISYNMILDEVLNDMDPVCQVGFTMNPSLLDDSIVDAFINLKPILNSSNHKNKTIRIKKVAYIMYWFLRHKPIQIFCSQGVWIEDVFVKNSSNYNEEDYVEANNELAWKIKHINEYVALTFAFSAVFDYEKMTVCEEYFKEMMKGKNKIFSCDSIEEMVDLIIGKLNYIISFKNISPEILEYFLIGCTYLFPFALNDEDY